MHYVSYPELLPEPMSAGAVGVRFHPYSVSFLGMDVTLIVALMLGDALGADGKSCIPVCLHPDSLLLAVRLCWLPTYRWCAKVDRAPGAISGGPAVTSPSGYVEMDVVFGLCSLFPLGQTIK